MSPPLHFLLVLFFSAVAVASPPEIEPASTEPSVPLGSAQIEKDLRSLPWAQFRSVVEAIPKLRAEVDAYGPLGWQFVQFRYATHNWRKGIDKLDEAQKKELAELIRIARGTGKKSTRTAIQQDKPGGSDSIRPGR